MTTVFPGVSKRSNDRVVTYLAVNPGSTAEQIMEATGLSKSQVHKVIRANDLISVQPGKTRAKTYKVDVERLTELAAMPVVAVKAVTYDEMAETNYLTLTDMTFERQILALKKSLERASSRLDNILQGRHIAIAVQTNRMQDIQQAQLIWAKALDDLERIKLMALVLDKFVDKYLYAPQARNTDWWSLFHKEKPQAVSEPEPVEPEVVATPKARPVIDDRYYDHGYGDKK